MFVSWRICEKGQFEHQERSPKYPKWVDGINQVEMIAFFPCYSTCVFIFFLTMSFFFWILTLRSNQHNFFLFLMDFDHPQKTPQQKTLVTFFPASRAILDLSIPSTRSRSDHHPQVKIAAEKRFFGLSKD